MRKNRLAIVVPCYNEEEVFPSSHAQLLELLTDLINRNKVSKDSYLLYVNDGSKDKTLELIKEAYQSSDLVRGISLAGNKGHQNALFCGLMKAKEDADILVSIDADLQDDILAIEKMIDEYQNGADIVYGVRSKRETDTFFKRFTAEGFYWFMHKMGAKTVYNSADFRLMSQRSVEELSLYGETHLFLRGIVPELGFKTAMVYYERKERTAGESKYPLKKMLSFAFDGITSFSSKPLTWILYLVILSIIFSFAIIIYSLVRHFSGDTIVGWTSLFASIWLIGGLQLIAIGVVGQYVGKTYIETKKRPRYFIDEYLKHGEK